MQQLKNEIAKVLSNNVGNRLTEELILGLSVRLGTLIEPPMRELERLRGQEAQKTADLERTDG